MATINAGGVVLPDEITSSIATAAQTPEPTNTPEPINFQGSALPGGVSAVPIDASTYLQITIAPNPSFPNPSGGVTINLTAKILTPQGAIVNCAYSYNFSVTAGLVAVSDMAPGYLVAVCATCETAGIPDGVLFVTAGLIHQPNAGLPYDALLCASYMSSVVPVGWPEGILRTVTDGDGFGWIYRNLSIPVGTQPSYTVVDVQVELLGMQVSLTTDAVAGNRLMSVIAQKSTGGNTQLVTGQSPQTASTTLSYLATGGGQYNIPGGGIQVCSVPLTTPNRLYQGDLVECDIINFDPNDQVNFFVLYGRAWL
jgi:hypothetical protein